MESYLYDDLYNLEETHWWHRAKRSLVTGFLKTYVKTADARLLDVGCGTGKNIETFGKLGEVYGIDISDKAIAYCKKRGLTRIKPGFAEKIPFKANYFDAVTLLDVLEHMDDEAVLKEIYRVLKPGGICIITVPAYQWLWSQWDVVLHHKRRYTKDGLCERLRKARFSLRFVSYVYTFLVLPALIVRFIKSHLYTSDGYESDFALTSDFLNSLFYFISRFEQGIMSLVPLFVGTTLVAVSQKPL